jgi:hypothetical protein
LQDLLTTGTGDAKVVDYRTLFLIPAGTALAAAVLLLLFFHPPRSAQKLMDGSNEAAPVGGAIPIAETGIRTGEPPVRRGERGV